MNETPELDEATADRLLEGGVAPDDAPQGYQDVARALHAAALTSSTPSNEDAGAAVAAFHDAIPTRRTARMQKWKIAAATLAGGLALSTGLAAADVLPDTAQDVASSALSRVGINVPDGGDDSTTVSTKKAAKTESNVEDDSTTTTHPDNHGSVVSNVARDDSTVGADHGAAVCATASDGQCQPDEAPGRSGTAGSQRSQTGSTNSNSSTGGSSNSSTSGSNTDGGSNSSSGGASSSTGSSSSSGSSSSTGGSSSTGSSSSSGGSSSGSSISTGSGTTD